MTVKLMAEETVPETAPTPMARTSEPPRQIRRPPSLQPALAAFSAIAAVLASKLQIAILILMAGGLTYLALSDPSAMRLGASGMFDVFALLMAVFVLR